MIPGRGSLSTIVLQSFRDKKFLHFCGMNRMAQALELTKRVVYAWIV
jgi:hypothetical protein